MRPRRHLALIGCVLLLATAAAAQENWFPQSVASGDPRPDSVVLWTRVAPPSSAALPDSVTLVVATDAELSNAVVSRTVEVDPRYGGAVKLRVEGLDPYTTYWYQFGVDGSASPVGRTRTAPAPDDPRPLRFAVVYCQDYISRYYNSYARLLAVHDEDLDFVVHLGDYLYESSGGSGLVDPTSTRTIQFPDPEGVISYGGEGEPRQAAASLENYRALYRTFQTDPMLQQVHERWPMVVIWDDHEFSNDGWQANGTYFNGRFSEAAPDRKRDAEQAFFESIPTEVGLDADGELAIDASVLYPNTRVYRDYLWGSLLHLVMPDLRTFRADHLIPEDALPGAVAVDEPTLRGLLGDVAFEAVAGSFDPYVNMDALGAVLSIFRQTAVLATAVGMLEEYPEMGLQAAVRRASDALRGNISTTYLNQLWIAQGFPPPFTETVQAGLPRGIPFLLMGKTGFFTSVGSRTLVANDPFQLYAASRYLATGGDAQEVYGGQQEAWLQGTMLASPATWKVLGHSFGMNPLTLDFTNPTIAALLPETFPEELRIRLITNNEDFNGLPQARQEVLGLLSLVPNSVVFSGDIHATFVTDHGNGVVEFTPPAVSSTTFSTAVRGAILSNPLLPAEAVALVDFLADLLVLSSQNDEQVSASDIVYANTSANGFGVVDVTQDALTVTLHEVDESVAFGNLYDDPTALEAVFSTRTFTVQDGQLSPGR